ncbi:MAG: chorismate synthase [Verrucomicrobia bacterium]|jgi:chorismate synthase|nr:chorismate synthase [Verrucomicrobiota bacterium]MBT7066131.1 chorismate synthase [Verrucomicrobiota bacterium]MBT7702008.1 chorismate synthase [Verrucomicrobiota bacterium]
MGSSFGTGFRVSTFGESHGVGVGAIVDGCPAQVEVSLEAIQAQADRRKPGQSDLTTQRMEADKVEILSGVQHGKTLGTPIGLLVKNYDQRPGDYGEVLDAPRPSHADFTYLKKYGVKAKSGGGRASARETAARVAAGALAEQYLQQLCGIEIVAWVNSVGAIGSDVDVNSVTRADVDTRAVRCPDPAAADAMEARIREVRDEGDSIGGTLMCVCRNVPAGWGEPIFDKAEALLAQAMLSIPACKAFEIGSGFAGTELRGSQHNDPFTGGATELGTSTNNSGGVQGGITNGMPIVFRVAFKPPATISRPQETVDYEGNAVTLQVTQGRHDPCVVPRAVPIVEAMAALVLADLARQV